MKTLFFLLILQLGFYSFVYCQYKDTVYLYNGQVLVGEIKYAQLGFLKIDDRDLKLVSIKMYKIKKMMAMKNIFKIQTSDKTIYYGVINYSTKNGYIDVHSDSSDVTLKLTDVLYMLELHKSFFKGLTGNVAAGFSFTKSNSLGQLNVSSVVNYAQKNFEHQLSASSIASIDSSKFSRDNENVQLFSNYSLDEVWFVSGLFNYQRNLELSLSRRFSEMLGAGRKMLVKNDLQLLLISGITLNQERTTSGENSGILYEIPIMMRFNYFRFRHPDLQISSIQTVYFGITEKGRVRYDSNNNFALTIIHNFSANLNIYTNYDSRPSAGSNSNFDYGTSFSLSYRF
jgi:Protein of unknown function, DUF481